MDKEELNNLIEKLNQESEWRVILKFSKALEKQLFEEIHSIHEYDTPQWVVWNVEASSDYAEWINSRK